MSDTTVVISNFNYAKYVPAAIESCARQTYPCNIIVVDDASDDGSWEDILAAKKKFSNNQITAIRLSANSGGNARGKNVGIALCDTEFVICLDSDDLLLPDSIQNRRSVFSDSIDWVHGTASRIADEGNYESMMRILDNMGARRLVSYNMYKDVISKDEHHTIWYKGVEASTVMARRSCYDQVGLYDEDLKWKIDREMWYRFLRNGLTKRFIDLPVSIYRKHKRQVTRDRKRKNPKEIDRMFNKTIKMRKDINSDNTLLLSEYDHDQYVDKIIV